MLSTIRQGSNGELVSIAQYLIGYAARGKASGIFDANFAAAVAAWQRAHKLAPDGIIGKNTWSKLAETAHTCSTAKNRTSTATCAIQLLLDGLNVDGIYGSKTKVAVAAYQAAKGLAADGICGPLTWAALITGETAAGEYKPTVDYKQYDSRWGSNVYSATGKKSQTMRSSGCGPTAAANVVATLKDPSVTPWTLAQQYLKKGFRTSDNGTAWAAMRWTAEQYGFSRFVQTSSLSTLKACLDTGGYVVCSMGPGYWTTGGHYICAWRYDGTYIYANDPASSKRTQQKQSDFVKQRKQYFCFWP